MTWLTCNDVCDRQEFADAFKKAVDSNLNVDTHALETLLDVAGVLRPCILPILLISYPQVRVQAAASWHRWHVPCKVAAGRSRTHNRRAIAWS